MIGCQATALFFRVCLTADLLVTACREAEDSDMKDSTGRIASTVDYGILGNTAAMKVRYL